MLRRYSGRHIDLACERLETLDPDEGETLVLHSDFTTGNILFEGDELSGVLDFEATHLNVRVADFALSWRGRYDDVIKGVQEAMRYLEAGGTPTKSIAYP